MQLDRPDRPSRFCPHIFMHWLLALATACALTACAATPDVVDHAFSFSTRYDNQDAEVLDYRYGQFQTACSCA